MEGDHNRSVGLGILVQHPDLCFPLRLGPGSHHQHAHHLQHRVQRTDGELHCKGVGAKVVHVDYNTAVMQ